MTARLSAEAAHKPRRRAGRAPFSASSPSPRYHQLYVSLRSWVQDGTYRPGQQIPTEPQLCKAFDVSRITVRKAITDLVREGWLVKYQGKGTFVVSSRARPAASLDMAQMRSQIADLAAITEVRDLRIEAVDPDEETQAALNLDGSARVQRATHIRMLRGVPLGLITTWVPLEIAAGLEPRDMSRYSMFELLGRAGLTLVDAEQWIGATLAGVEAARRLAIDVGAPLLRISRVVHAEGGRAVERVLALYRADAYQYRMRLGPSSDASA